MNLVPERRATRQQRAIREATERLTSFSSSQRVHDELRSAGIDVGLSTVYRTLHALAERGEIDSVVSPSGEVWYRACAPSDDEHLHHHLVCRLCGRAVTVEEPAVSTWIERVEAESRFTGVMRTLQLSGICADCAARDQSAQDRPA